MNKDQLHNQIESIASLRKDWDGYNSEPPTSESCQVAHHIIDLLIPIDKLIPQIVPVPNGGVQLEFRCNHKELELEVLSNGQHIWFLAVSKNNDDTNDDTNKDEVYEESQYPASDDEMTKYLIYWLIDRPFRKMVCSHCSSIIDKSNRFINNGYGWFNTRDRSWTCPQCNFMWLSSDGWHEVGNLLIPYCSHVDEMLERAERYQQNKQVKSKKEQN